MLFRENPLLHPEDESGSTPLFRHGSIFIILIGSIILFFIALAKPLTCMVIVIASQQNFVRRLPYRSNRWHRVSRVLEPTVSTDNVADKTLFCSV